MKKIYIISLLGLFFSLKASAQLGFCSGSKGDPIFHEDFGSGSGTGSELGASITSYRFVKQDPQDGEYTIADDIGNFITSWHSILPATTISNGKALIVNADYNAGKFYEKKISGLCENSSYEFSAFLMNIYNKASNVCANQEIPNNVKFEIWDKTNSVVLKSGSTGDIYSTNSPAWKQYALTFQSEPGQDAVILKMYNNGEGGCGNDLAIDDIIFSSCGDLTEISTAEDISGSVDICEENIPFESRLTANPDNSVYNEHYYQWQYSSDGANWQDIQGAIQQNYDTGSINTTTYFRVKVAEDEVNLQSNVCSSVSEAFKVHIIKTPDAPVKLSNYSVCENEAIPALRVDTPAGISVNWYDKQTGGTLLAEATHSFIPDAEGTFYAEAVNPVYECAASARTAVKLEIFTVPTVNDEELQICPDDNLVLSAGADAYAYKWNTGETSEAITIETPGTYSVELITENECSVTKLISVEEVDDAGLGEIISEAETIKIIPEFDGKFLFSLDGINFQESNVFTNIPGGIYTAYIKDTQNCKLESREFAHIVIPVFISPNRDGFNDSFELNGIEFFGNSEIRIFDRYGKLIKIDSGENFSWDGKLLGEDLPADDYWYLIKIEGFPEQTGHFSLLR